LPLHRIMNKKNQQVLLIEDNRDDVFLMQRAVKKSGVPWTLQVAMDGQEALDFFSGSGKFSDRNQFPMPSLVFLDLKLPYVSGFDVLSSMQSQPELREILVIILTSSPEDRDQQRALELGAKGYLIKPPTGEVLRKIADGEWVAVGQGIQTKVGL
jgi:CheY-like chemotaxis protein